MLLKHAGAVGAVSSHKPQQFMFLSDFFGFLTMGARGRKTAGDHQAETAKAKVLDEKGPPKPPKDLTDDQAAEWRAIVDVMPNDWFGPETYPLLAQYCRHITGARAIAGLLVSVERADEVDIREYDRLLRMRERESKVLSTLATKMRITHQSRYDDKAAHRKHANNKPRPWEIGIR